MTFDKAFSLGVRLARRFGPQYLIEWQGDWAITSYRPTSGVRVVEIDLSKFTSLPSEQDLDMVS